jgi:4-oxalocrotonate tautomerase
MPLVQIKLIKGVVTNEKKREMLSKVTEAVISVEGENVRPYTLVTIDEVESGDWAVGGRPLETDEVKAVIAGERGKVA